MQIRRIFIYESVFNIQWSLGWQNGSGPCMRLVEAAGLGALAAAH